MKIPNYQLIDTAGQYTPVFSQSIPNKNQKLLISKKLLEEFNPLVGQVAFINKNQVQMMGSELSINGSIAAGFVLSKKLNLKKVTFKTSGLGQPFAVKFNCSTTSIYLPKTIIKSINDNLVSLSGIKYLVEPKMPKKLTLTKKQKKVLRKLTQNCPAAGIVFYQQNKIKLLVYVKSTNTFIWETACGSGSLAYYLTAKEPNIIQPSGKTINIEENNDKLIITMPIKEIYV